MPDREYSPAIPDWTDVPEDDSAEPDDLDADHEPEADAGDEL